MIYLRFKLQIINKVCGEITEQYGLDKQIAYKVFKETEDEFTIRGYLDELELQKMGERSERLTSLTSMNTAADLQMLENLTQTEKQSMEYLERDVDLERLLKVEQMDLSVEKRHTRISDVLKLCLHYLTPADVKEVLFVNKTFWRQLQIPFTKWILVSYNFENQKDRVAAWWTLLPEVSC
jgi:hypothetical protein